MQGCRSRCNNFRVTSTTGHLRIVAGRIAFQTFVGGFFGVTGRVAAVTGITGDVTMG